jgi:hypothetical protein
MKCLKKVANRVAGEGAGERVQGEEVPQVALPLRTGQALALHCFCSRIGKPSPSASLVTAALHALLLIRLGPALERACTLRDSFQDDASSTRLVDAASLVLLGRRLSAACYPARPESAGGRRPSEVAQGRAARRPALVFPLRIPLSEAPPRHGIPKGENPSSPHLSSAYRRAVWGPMGGFAWAKDPGPALRAHALCISKWCKSAGSARARPPQGAPFKMRRAVRARRVPGA